jgi:hypothetical protein
VSQLSNFNLGTCIRRPGRCWGALLAGLCGDRDGRRDTVRTRCRLREAIRRGRRGTSSMRALFLVLQVWLGSVAAAVAGGGLKVKGTRLTYGDSSEAIFLSGVCPTVACMALLTTPSHRATFRWKGAPIDESSSVVLQAPTNRGFTTVQTSATIARPMRTTAR